MAFWIAGTLAGGALGLVVMMHPALATNRLALWAILALAAAAAGLHNPTRYRVSVTLCLMTLSAIVLCQCCDTVGHWEYSVARVIAVLSGVLTAAVVCNSLAPWCAAAAAAAATLECGILQATSQQQQQQ